MRDSAVLVASQKSSSSRSINFSLPQSCRGEPESMELLELLFRLYDRDTD